MVVDDLHIEGIGSLPNETDPPSVIDANAVLTLTLTPQLLEPVTRRNAKVLNGAGALQEHQLSPGHALEGSIARNISVMEELLRISRPERPDHRPDYIV